MNTCGTGKHFGPLVPDMDDDSGDETVPSTYHKCLLLKHLNDGRCVMNAVAGVVDGSGYYAAFCVHEEFGCNQWAAPTVEPVR